MNTSKHHNNRNMNHNRLNRGIPPTVLNKVMCPGPSQIQGEAFFK